MNFFIIFFTTSFIMSLIMLLLFGFSIISGGKVTAKTRYIMWIILLIGLVIPFRPLLGDGLITLDTPNINEDIKSIVYLDKTNKIQELDNKELNNNTNIVKSNQQINIENTRNEEAKTFPFDITSIILIIWALGALVLFLKYIIEYRKFYNIVKRWSTPVEDISVLEIFEWTKARMGLENKNINLLTCNMITTPMLTGILKPTILLPEKDIKDDEMELILAHELTHYKHKDIIVNLLSIIALCIHWFNPIIYFCFPAILGDGESCCDEAVLKNKDIDYRRFYGEVIISMIQASPQKQIAFSTCFYAKKLNIKRRLFNIMETNKNKRNLSMISIITILCLTFISGSVIVFANPKAQSNIDVKRARQIVLNDLKLSEDEIDYVKISLDKENKKEVYNIGFYNKGTEYDYKIDAKTGKIIDVDNDIENYKVVDAKPNGAISDKNIDKENKSKNKSVIDKKDINELNSSDERDYEQKNNKEKQQNIIKQDNSTSSSNSNNDKIMSKEKAKSIILENMGSDSSQANVSKVDLDNDDKKQEYNVTVKKDDAEYEYEVNAKTGEITKFEKQDEESPSQSVNQSNTDNNNNDDDDDNDDDNDDYNDDSDSDNDSDND